MSAASVAPCRILRQTSAYHTLQGLGRDRADILHLRRWRVHDLVQRIERVLALERLLSGRRLEQQTAEREDVRSMIDLVDASAGLLGRHIPDRAEHHARHRLRHGFDGSLRSLLVDAEQP